jgi:hypothetical protein
MHRTTVQERFPFQKRKRSVTAYLRNVKSTRKRADVYDIYKDNLVREGLWSPDIPMPRLCDSSRQVLGDACFAVADEIENRVKRPTVVSRMLYDVGNDVLEGIQANRDDFYGTKEVSGSRKLAPVSAIDTFPPSPEQHLPATEAA